MPVMLTSSWSFIKHKAVSHLAVGRRKPKDVVESPRGKQTGVGRHPGTVELQLHATIEIDPKRLLFRFTHRVRDDQPRPNYDNILIPIGESRPTAAKNSIHLGNRGYE
jgi:hypothetical protein